MTGRNTLTQRVKQHDNEIKALRNWIVAQGEALSDVTKDLKEKRENNDWGNLILRYGVEGIVISTFLAILVPRIFKGIEPSELILCYTWFLVLAASLQNFRKGGGWSKERMERM